MRKEKVYTLSYADNTVLMVKGKDEMRSMMNRLEEYLDIKGMELNPN